MSSGDPVPLLLVEDDSSLAGTLDDFLSARGYEVDFAFNGRGGIERAINGDYAVIVMDVSMPMMDGLSACEQMRREHGITTPIIFLTARDTLADKLAGYESGGDDYLVKPFAPEELVCRIEALRKRPPMAGTADLRFGELAIFPSRLQVHYAGQALQLHETQVRLLLILARSAPEFVAKSALQAGLWPEGIPESDPLRNYVYRLRKQLSDCFGHHFIKTVHGKGYRLELPD